jgi:hypothetical protein
MSRKLKITIASIGLSVLIPIIYQLLGISEGVTMLVVGALIGLPSTYNFSNAMAKKYEQNP